MVANSTAMASGNLHRLVELTHDALVAHTSEFSGLHRGGFLYRDEHMAIMAAPSGIQESSCTAFRLDPGFDAGKFMDKANELFGRANLPFTVLLRDECDADIDIVCDEMGMGHLSPPMPRMIAEQTVQPSSAARVYVATTEADIENWIDIVGNSFGSEYPPDALRTDMDPQHILDHQALTFLLAAIGDEPVSAGMFYRYGTLGYISNVGTLSQFRRRGAASALVRHATNLALEDGAECSFLFASHGAERIWERVGYKAISYIHHRITL